MGIFPTRRVFRFKIYVYSRNRFALTYIIHSMQISYRYIIW